jgi:hypothetical protein
MEKDLHHPSPRLPDGWKQFQADNIDITTTSDVNTGRHSRSPSVISNHNYPQQTLDISQLQQNNGHLDVFDSNIGGGGSGGGDVGIKIGSHHLQNMDSQFNSGNAIPTHFQDTPEFDFSSETRSSSGGGNNSYFHPTANTNLHHASTAAMNNTATNIGQPSLQSNTLIQSTSNPLSPSEQSANSNNFENYYLSTDSSPSFLNNTNSNTNNTFGTTSPPIVPSQDTLSPFAGYQNTFDQGYTQYEPSSNTLGLHWSHHRSLSDQSDLSSNASPFIGSVHSEHNSPYIHPQQDNTFEDDLREAILGLDMGAPFDVTAQQHFNPTQQFDTSTLELDQQGFPIDAPLFDHQEYYDAQQQQQQNSRPTSSSSYHHPSYSQSIFSNSHPTNISIPSAFQSPPLQSATSIPEIEVTVAPPTPRSQAYNNQDSYFPHPYNPAHRGSAHNSPSHPPAYFHHSSEITPLALPPTHNGRRRAVSDSGTRPSMSMMPPHTTLARRVSSGSHPYLAVNEGSPSSSGRSTPNRGHRKSFSSGHNMTHREVLELVKNEGPREAKNPKKFICDYPGCGQRFTRNSNKTYFPYIPGWWAVLMVGLIC